MEWKFEYFVQRRSIVQVHIHLCNGHRLVRGELQGKSIPFGEQRFAVPAPRGVQQQKHISLLELLKKGGRVETKNNVVQTE